MNKAGLIWCAKGLGLDTSGTAPEIEQRIAVENTPRDAEIVRISDPVMADVLVAIAPLRHQLADRATLADIEPDTARDYYAEEKLDGMRIWLVGYRHRYFVFSRNYTVDIRLNAITNIANINLDGFPCHHRIGCCLLYTITGGPVSQDGPALYHGNGNLSGS